MYSRFLAAQSISSDGVEVIEALSNTRIGLGLPLGNCFHSAIACCQRTVRTVGAEDDAVRLELLQRQPAISVEIFDRQPGIRIRRAVGNRWLGEMVEDGAYQLQPRWPSRDR